MLQYIKVNMQHAINKRCSTNVKKCCIASMNKNCGVNTTHNVKRKLKALYQISFPKNERLPFLYLLVMAGRKGITLSAVYEERKFVGLLFYLQDEINLILYYFAVVPKLRGQGYGSHILKDMKKRNHGKNIYIIIESLSEPCENMAQRKHRKAYYLRNGFTDTGYHFTDYGGKLDILGSSKKLDTGKFQKLIRKLTFWDVNGTITI